MAHPGFTFGTGPLNTLRRKIAAIEKKRDHFLLMYKKRDEDVRALRDKEQRILAHRKILVKQGKLAGDRIPEDLE